MFCLSHSGPASSPLPRSKFWNIILSCCCLLRTTGNAKAKQDYTQTIRLQTNSLTFLTLLGFLQDAAVHQHSNCICASFLHVPFLHQVPQESHCCLCPISRRQSGRAAQEAWTCHQGGSHDSFPQSETPWRQFRGSWHYFASPLFSFLFWVENSQLVVLLLNMFSSNTKSRRRNSSTMRTFCSRLWALR